MSFLLRRRFWLWAGGLMLLVVFVGMGLFSYLKVRADRRLALVVAGLDRTEPGWRLTDIEAKREQVPDERNSAPVVRSAKALLPAGWQQQPAFMTGGTEPSLGDRLLLGPPEAAVDPADVTELGTILKTADAALAEALRLADLPRGRHAIDWMAVAAGPAPDHVMEVREVANLLKLEALRRAFSGDPDGAIVATRAILNTGRSLGDEPSLISQLVRIAIDAVAGGTVARVLAQCEPSEKALADLQGRFAEEAAEPLFTHSVRGERAAIDRVLTAVREGKAKASELGPFVPEGGRIADAGFAFLAGRAHPEILELLTEIVRVSKGPPETWGQAMADFEQKAKGGEVITRLFVPAVAKIGEAERRRLAGLRTAIVAVAAERYRLANGKWPRSTSDLQKAGLLKEVPADPYDGRPIRLAPRDGGLTVYSVGPDGSDNGGTAAEHDRPDPGSDNCFKLWDADRRGRPQRELMPLPRELGAPQ